MLKKGDEIPTNITVRNAGDIEVTLQNYLGQYLILYFYPGDFTPTCTTEACSIRDMLAEKNLEKELGAKIIGISSDSSKRHNKFKEKFNLNFELLSDQNHDLQNAFGVWAEKSLFGRKYMGTLRTTFLVDPKGKIVYIWEKVKSAKHGEEVYNKLKEIKNGP